MDIVTAAYAANKTKAELASTGQIGSAERKVFTYDGNLERYPHFVSKEGQYGLKISDEPIDLEDLAKVVWTYSNGESLDLNIEEIKKYKINDRVIGLMSSKYTAAANSVITCYYDDNNDTAYPEATRGTYIFDDRTGKDRSGYVSYLETKETIRTIDHKFIPGFIPTVELANPEAITDEENAALSACIGDLIIIKFTGRTFLCNYVLSGSTHMFVASLTLYGNTAFVSEDGKTWAIDF